MRWLMGLAGAVIATTSAMAQDQDPFQQAARETKLQSVDPFAVLFVSGAFGSPADSYSFYAFWDKPWGAPDRRRGFAVRKASRTEAAVQWTTSFSCDALEPALGRMEAVPPPRIDVWGVGEDAPPHLVADGVSFDLWSRWPSWPGSTGYFVRMGSNLGSPLADWGTAITQDLAPCWSDQAPGAIIEPNRP